MADGHVYRRLVTGALIALLSVIDLQGAGQAQQRPENDPSGSCASPIASPAASPAASPTFSPLSSPVASPAASPCASPAAGGAPIVIQVIERDFMMVAPETTFTVDQPYTFVAMNNGKAEHELVIEPKGVVDQALTAGGRVAEADDIAPGQSKPLTWTFTKPGAYQFACHKPGHYQAGMVLTIEVAP